MELKTLAARVKQLREGRGWTQEELSARSGVDQSTLSKIETGRIGNPQPRTLAALARVLETTAAALMGRPEPLQMADLSPEEASIVRAYRLATDEKKQFLLGAAALISASPAATDESPLEAAEPPQQLPGPA